MLLFWKLVDETQMVAPREYTDAFIGGYFNLTLCSVMLPHFICKIWCLNEQNLMLCYAVLWFVMLTYFMSKILCSQWVKSCDLLCSHFWEIMIEIFVSKTLCTVMNSYLMSKILLNLMKLTISYCGQGWPLLAISNA